MSISFYLLFDHSFIIHYCMCVILRVNMEAKVNQTEVILDLESSGA